MPTTNVLGLFPPPDRETSLRAISRALLRIRSNGWTAKALAQELGCCADTIEAACNEKSMLGFEHIAQLGFKFPEEFAFVEALWLCRAPTETTADDHAKAIAHHTEALLKMGGRS